MASRSVSSSVALDAPESRGRDACPGNSTSRSDLHDGCAGTESQLSGRGNLNPIDAFRSRRRVVEIALNHIDGGKKRKPDAAVNVKRAAAETARSGPKN
jgi:hypothetical protein